MEEDKRKGYEDKHLPLYMTALPEEDEWEEELQAIQALVYEGDTPEEIAENLKECGNEAFMRFVEEKEISKRDESDLHQAIHLYTEAIKQKSTIDENVSKYHNNRAAVWMKLQRNGEAFRDAKIALKLNPKNVKACYRGMVASERCKYWEQAIDFCKQGAQLEPDNATFKKKLAVFEKALSKKREEEAARAKEKERKEANEENTTALLRQAGIKVGPPAFPPEWEMHYKPTVTIGEDLRIPLCFLYEEYRQFDFVQLVGESDTLYDHLCLMFPARKGDSEVQAPEWDTRGDYILGNLVVYFPSSSGKNMVTVPLEAPLGNILHHPEFIFSKNVAVLYVCVGNSTFWKSRVAAK
eukprot:CAMPEP_0119129970 /NCGR_PEP_ID=MMETSP1310-20130426/7498_1 /TAXON_ID=464262 /ORGANISM="Genus nov. species nov., Strain RCC2339" /LENGTH=352 /DNA_ID=CAMNT_0007120433 /DNA_START=46 /DNA_END=1104 /DNA_ORIENTATION=-